MAIISEINCSIVYFRMSRVRQCEKDIILQIGDEIGNFTLFYNMLGQNIITFPICGQLS